MPAAIDQRIRLTPETQAAIIYLVANNVPPNRAAVACGLAERTYWKWMKRGKLEPKSRYGEFRAQLKKAEAQAIEGNLDVLNKARHGGTLVERRTITKKDGSVEVFEKFSAPQWIAAAWMLERRWPQHFARRDTVNVRTPTLSQLIEEIEKLEGMLGIKSRKSIEELPDANVLTDQGAASAAPDETPGADQSSGQVSGYLSDTRQPG